MPGPPFNTSNINTFISHFSGSAANKKSQLFSGTPNNQNAGLWGAPATDQSRRQGLGLFDKAASHNGGSPFGNSRPVNSNSSLFAAPGQPSNLFGGSSPFAAPSQPSSLFGRPANHSTSPYPNHRNPQGGMFASMNQQTSRQASSHGLFGTMNNNSSGGGLFKTQNGTSLFGDPAEIAELSRILGYNVGVHGLPRDWRSSGKYGNQGW